MQKQTAHHARHVGVDEPRALKQVGAPLARDDRFLADKHGAVGGAAACGAAAAGVGGAAAAAFCIVATTTTSSSTSSSSSSSSRQRRALCAQVFIARPQSVEQRDAARHLFRLYKRPRRLAARYIKVLDTPCAAVVLAPRRVVPFQANPHALLPRHCPNISHGGLGALAAYTDAAAYDRKLFTI
jgi:hypothetical protein